MLIKIIGGESMREYYIPTNFEDNGKLLGLFGIRNVIEAGCLSLPFIYVIFIEAIFSF